MSLIVKHLAKYNDTVRKGFKPSLDIFKNLVQLTLKSDKQLKLVLNRMHYMGYRKEPLYLFAQLRLTKDLSILKDLEISSIETVNQILTSVSNQSVEKFEHVYRQLFQSFIPNERSCQILIEFYSKNSRIVECFQVYRALQGQSSILQIPNISFVPSKTTNELMTKALSKHPDPSVQMEYLMEIHKANGLSWRIFDILASGKGFRTPYYCKGDAKFYAIELYQLIEKLGMDPSEIVYTAIVLSLLRASKIEKAMEWIGLMQKREFLVNMDIQKGLLRFYLKQNDFDACLRIYDSMKVESKIPESVIVDLVQFMVQTILMKTTPNKDCALLIDELWGKYQAYRKSSFPRPTRLYNALLQYYTRNLDMDNAVMILKCAIEDMVVPSSVNMANLFKEYERISGNQQLLNLIRELELLIEPKSNGMGSKLQVWNVDGIFDESYFLDEKNQIVRANEYPSRMKARLSEAMEQSII